MDMSTKAQNVAVRALNPFIVRLIRWWLAVSQRRDQGVSEARARGGVVEKTLKMRLRRIRAVGLGHDKSPLNAPKRSEEVGLSSASHPCIQRGVGHPNNQIRRSTGAKR